MSKVLFNRRGEERGTLRVIDIWEEYLRYFMGLPEAIEIISEVEGKDMTEQSYIYLAHDQKTYRDYVKSVVMKWRTDARRNLD